jgi:hypothetical protein
MAGQLKLIAGPAYIAASATNIYTPPNAAVDTVIKQILVSNKTASPATFTLYVGATGGSAGGTELVGLSQSVPANTSLPPYYFSPGLRLTSSQFLTGIASAGSTLVITVMGEYVAN